jgi:hypothetical protein
MQPVSDTEPVVGVATQVHHIETTAAVNLPKTYRDYLLTHDRAEWDQALVVYWSHDHEHFTSYHTKLEQCRTWSWFARNTVTGKVRVMSNSCRLRWCPFCARTRYIAIRTELTHWVNKLRRPKFLTLTYRHSTAPLIDQVTALYAAFRKLRQHKVIKQAVRGGVWFFQLKSSPKSGQWHPHLHIVLDSDYISKFLLSAEWLRTTGNSFIIDIRAIKQPDKIADYVARYAARPCRLSDFDSQAALDIFTLFHRRRLAGTFGTGRAVKLRPQPQPDFADWVRIGSWTQIVSMHVRPDCCKRIIQAWIDDTPISPSDCPDFLLIEFQQATLGEPSVFTLESVLDKVSQFW